MLGTFTYHNPTKIYFGPNALEGLADELTKYGPNVVLVYGGGSIKKNGVYDQVTAVLNATGKNVTEIADVMPNPTVEKLREGVAMAKAASANLILAVGGGSVCDYSKAVSVSANCDEAPGRNTSFVSRSRVAPLFPWDACSPWPARVRK